MRTMKINKYHNCGDVIAWEVKKCPYCGNIHIITEHEDKLHGETINYMRCEISDVEWYEAESIDGWIKRIERRTHE